MTVRPVCLDPLDAVELGEMLEFVGQWLASDGDRLGASLARFMGTDSYGIEELRADVMRFAFLLPGTDGELLFGEAQR